MAPLSNPSGIANGLATISMNAPSKTLKYLITGGSGFIGSELCKQLQGHDVFVLTRNVNKTKKKFARLAIRHARFITALDDFDEAVDVIINLAGAGIFDRRWTQRYKHILLNSRVGTTQAIYHYLKRTGHKPQSFITGSAVGIYGEQSTSADESTELGTGFASELCQQWEQAAQAIANLGINTCHLRLGVVTGNGGMLQKTAPSVKFGLGAYFGDGTSYLPWIALQDVIASIQFLIAYNKQGIYNIVAPQQLTQKQFMDTLATTMQRTIHFSMPALLLSLLLGQSAKEVLLVSQRIQPQKLLDEGYPFQYHRLEALLSDLKL